MSENSYPNPEKTATVTFAESILNRTLVQFKRVSRTFMSPEEFDQKESVTLKLFLATNKDKTKPRDSLLVDEASYQAYSSRLLGRVVRGVTFTKDNGDISLGLEVAEATKEDEAADRQPAEQVLASNPDGVFISGIPVDLAIAMEAPLMPDSGNILQQFDLIMRDIEVAQVVGFGKPGLSR